MRIATMASVAILGLSTAALATGVTGAPAQTMNDTMAMDNMADNSMMSNDMMSNNMAMPEAATPDAKMSPTRKK